MEKKYNLCIAADWEYDNEFIKLLEQKALSIGLTTYVVENYNLNETIRLLEKNDLKFDYFFDRASDTSSDFIKLHRLCQEKKIKIFETLEQLNWSTDKATMHLEFITNGLNTPYSIIIPPFKEIEKIHISIADFAKLGRPFIIKPANTTGGGIGVVHGAETLQDVLLARSQYKHDKYLLQEKVIPLEKDNKTFWFRGFFACGSIYCTWWNPYTHIYEILNQDDVENYGLNSLYGIVRKISEICKLNFFTTEIALTAERKFVVVDYVNISSDMRLKSIHYDGVPDEIVKEASEKLIVFLKKEIVI
jgi:hypothetical protein